MTRTFRLKGQRQKQFWARTPSVVVNRVGPWGERLGNRHWLFPVTEVDRAFPVWVNSGRDRALTHRGYWAAVPAALQQHATTVKLESGGDRGYRAAHTLHVQVPVTHQRLSTLNPVAKDRRHPYCFDWAGSRYDQRLLYYRSPHDTFHVLGPRVWPDLPDDLRRIAATAETGHEHVCANYRRRRRLVTHLPPTDVILRAAAEVDITHIALSGRAFQMADLYAGSPHTPPDFPRGRMLHCTNEREPVFVQRFRVWHRRRGDRQWWPLGEFSGNRQRWEEILIALPPGLRTNRVWIRAVAQQGVGFEASLIGPKTAGVLTEQQPQACVTYTVEQPSPALYRNNTGPWKDRFSLRTNARTRHNRRKALRQSILSQLAER